MDDQLHNGLDVRIEAASDALTRMLLMQLDLQLRAYGEAPDQMSGAKRKDYVRTMAYALTDEVHEATNEVAWKPWATADFMRRGAYLKELVDAWHFFMNLLLVAIGPDSLWETPEQLAKAFVTAYEEKHLLNAKRQEEGYDGVTTKCPGCHRAYDEPGCDGETEIGCTQAKVVPGEIPFEAWCAELKRYV